MYGVLGAIYRMRYLSRSILARISLNELSGGRDQSGPYNLSLLNRQIASLHPRAPCNAK